LEPVRFPRSLSNEPQEPRIYAALVCGCVAQLVEQRSPKPRVGGSSPSALVDKDRMSTIIPQKKKQSFFREVINELKKVTWTSKEELLMSTKAVIIATFVFGLMIYVCDLLIRGTVTGIGTLVRMMFG
jgi:preprotein translocase subunit SecE